MWRVEDANFGTGGGFLCEGRQLGGKFGKVFNAVPAGPVAQQIEVLQPVVGILLPKCCVVSGRGDFLVKVDV